MPQAFRADGTFFDPLVTKLSEAVTETAGMSLRGNDRITTRIKIDTFNLTVALTFALDCALTDVVKENPGAISPDTPVIDEVGQLKNILVDALNGNPSSPTLNNDSFKVFLKDALIPAPQNERA